MTLQLVRIVETEYGDPGILRVRGVFEDVTDYVSTVQGANPLNGGVQELTIPGATRLALLDIATLRDADDGPGYYVTVSGVLSSWRGAMIYLSTDGGLSYAPLVAMTQHVPTGYALTKLAAGPTRLWDEANTVDVQMLNDEPLLSLTEDQILEGKNLIHLGTELLLYQTSTQLADRQYRLGRLLRGVLGTEWAVDGHAIGDGLVALPSGAGVERVADALNQLNATRQYRAVSFDDIIESAATKTFVNTGVSLKPLAPVDIQASFDGSNNIVFTALRRSRLWGQNGRDFYDPPLGEETESWELDILSDDEITVKRTLTASTIAGLSYSAANQTTDFGAAKEYNLHLKLYQISAAVGRGYPGHAVVNPIGVAEGEYFGFLYQDGTVFQFEDGEHILFQG